jgi:cytidylate kinase
MPNVIAIDGPAASGKSTVARRVAAALGRLYVDSGALYRGVTWHVLRCGVDAGNAGDVVAAMRKARFEFDVRDGAVVFTIDGVAPGDALRTAEINSRVSPVAANPEVRRQVTAWLRDMERHGALVMEGRDIGTAVFPDAPHRFYLDASEEERARRRHAEAPQQASSVADVSRSLRSRDRMDSTRQAAPLRVAEGSVVVDTTGLTIDEVVSRILTAVRPA